MSRKTEPHQKCSSNRPGSSGPSAEIAPPSADHSAIDLRPARTGPERRDQRQGRRVRHARSEPTEHPSDEQDRVRRRVRGEEAGRDRERRPEDQHPLASVAVPDRAEVQHRGREPERVPDGDQVERRLGRVERRARSTAARRSRPPGSGSRRPPRGSARGGRPPSGSGWVDGGPRSVVEHRLRRDASFGMAGARERLQERDGGPHVIEEQRRSGPSRRRSARRSASRSGPRCRRASDRRGPAIRAPGAWPRGHADPSRTCWPSFSVQVTSGMSEPSFSTSNGSISAIAAAKRRRGVLACLLTRAIALAAEAEEVVVLQQHLRCRGARSSARAWACRRRGSSRGRSRSSGRYSRLGPDDPPEARVHEPELVPRRVDGVDARQPEVPHEVAGRGTAR